MRFFYPLILWLERKFCRHVIYIEELTRIHDELVTARCHKCGKPFASMCGLDFYHTGATLDQRPCS